MVRREVIWWLRIAEKNVKRAQRSLEDGDYEASCFWSQQAVEASLKALIIYSGREPPKIHNLVDLYGMVKNILGPVDEATLSEIIPYYSISRYPDVFGGIPVVHKNTAQKFLRFAKDIVRRASEVISVGDS